MKRKKIYDPYAELIDRFNRRGVKYVVVGMSGINYYAMNAQDTFATQDFDIFINPTITNVKKAISILKELDYSLIANRQKIDETSVKDIVRRKSTILATDPYGVAVELILAVSGYTFSQMDIDAKVFDVSQIPIKVARLNKLLLSKKIAGRQKDKMFLKRFEMLLKEKKKAMG